jgi:hypothetical protein
MFQICGPNVRGRLQRRGGTLEDGLLRGSRLGCPSRSAEPPSNEETGGPHQATHERVHGVVASPAEENCSREPENAQFGDLQKIR